MSGLSHLHRSFPLKKKPRLASKGRGLSLTRVRHLQSPASPSPQCCNAALGSTLFGSPVSLYRSNGAFVAHLARLASPPPEGGNGWQGWASGMSNGGAQKDAPANRGCRGHFVASDY